MTSSPEPMDGSVLSEEPGEFPPLPDKDEDAAKAARKARRQTAIYPNTLRSTPKPFSRSAAKRESVMALGSIEHLQHYFTKTGIAAKQKPSVRTKGLVPAIGGARHVRAASSVTSIPELPPSPMVPKNASSRPPFMHVPKTYEVDPDHLRPGVVRDLKAVEQAWRLSSSSPAASPDASPQPSSFDVLTNLRITTRAIRSVRDYVVSLPDDHPTHSAKSAVSYRSPAFTAPSPNRPAPIQSNPSQPSLASVLQQTVGAPVALSKPSGSLSPRPSMATLSPRPSMATLSPRPSMATLSPRPSMASLSVQNTGASNASSTSPGGQSSQPFPSRPEEPLALVRRAALDVLTALRALEERARVAGAERDPTAQQDTRSNSSRSDTPAEKGMFHSGDEAEKESSTSLSLSSPAARAGLPRLQTASGTHTETLLVHGRGAVQVWSDSDDDDEPVEPEEKREIWDEKLVLGGGWLYRRDLGLDDVLDEVSAVKRYLDVVDAVLFSGPSRGGKRGWDRERRKGRKSENPTGPSMSMLSDSEDEPSGLRFASLSLMGDLNQSVLEEEEEGEDDGEDGVGDGELPGWASVEPFGGDLIARTNALLQYFLPPHLSSLLPAAPTRESLLMALSDGQMLCVAYNAAVRKSKKAWGFINSSSIHETASGLTEESGRTFRRKDNLGLWAAALKLRYVIDIVPSHSKQSTKQTRHFHQAPAPEVENAEQGEANVFSPIVVAKHETGWEDMFERAIWEWVNAVVSETKEAVGKS